jgi:hypothetical protein
MTPPFECGIIFPSSVLRCSEESNGGVMDDPHRAGPKEGTRGTEGGVSEKGKEGKLGSFSLLRCSGVPKRESWCHI